MQCNCPAATAITTIPTVTCIESFGEIQKIILQRTYSSGTTLNTIDAGDSADGIELLATWTDLKAANDSTKVQVTPIIAELSNEVAEPREASSTGVAGISRILGDDYSPWSGFFHDLPQTIAKKLDDYNCELNLSIYLINEHGQIGCLADDNESPSTFRGIPAVSFFVGSKIFGGYADVDKNPVMWKFKPNFSKEFAIVTPSDFDAVLDL
jgi:hypothetical protein